MKPLLLVRQFAVWLGLLGSLAVSQGAPAAATPAPDRPVRVLLFSGLNNHEWKATTPKLQSILLTPPGRFEVTVTEHPEECTAETFARFDVILSNWNNFGQKEPPPWPPAMRAAFLQFVRSGHGLVSVHAGSSSFLDWPEYQDLNGGGWGAQTGHGPIHEFTVQLVATNHPITRGLAAFQTTDELWHRMAVHERKTVLATAFSDLQQSGSGQAEPVAFVIDYGRGRCFNLVLGHNAAAMESAGFQTLLRRGTEWAATGDVRPASAVDSKHNP